MTKQRPKIRTMMRTGILLCALLTGLWQPLKAQTTLSTGDIGVSSYNSDGNADTFAIMFLRDITAGTEIIITDAGWIDASSCFKLMNISSAYQDWFMIWRATADMTKGSQLKVHNSVLSTNGIAAPIVSAGTIVGGRMLNIPTNGDQIFVLQGSTIDSNSALKITGGTVICGMHGNYIDGTTDDADWDQTHDGTNQNISELPPTLTTGVNAVRFSCPTCSGSLQEWDNVQYDCSVPITASTSELRAALSNEANFLKLNVGPFSPAVVDCTPVSSSPSVTVTAQSNVSCNGGSNGSLTASASGGTPGYTYHWSPVGGSLATATGLSAGTYTCTVTDGASGTATVSATITQPTAISISGTSQTNIACNGGTTGAASISAPTGGAGSYTYNWTPGNPTGDGTISVTGLSAGTWTCTVTDANACNTIRTFTITQPSAISISGTSQTNIACNGGSSGAASINTPTGGAGGYSYNWTPGNPAGDGTISVTGLAALTWTCTVTDANSCTATKTFSITQPTALVVTAASQTNVACNGASNGAAAVNTPTGGAGGYTYNWTPGNPTGDGTTSVTGLTAGSWTCTVTDVNGCTASQSFTITQTAGMSISGTSQTNIACNGGSTGAASIVAPTGGAGGYTYNWTPGNPTGDGTTSVTGLVAGTWTCTVTDANGCSATRTFTITQPSAISISGTSQTNIACNGGSSGAASIVTPSGGAGSYTYDWTPGTPTGDGTTAISGLSIGGYVCTVSDANGCTVTRSFTITQLSAISVSAASQTNVSCNGGSNGTASINPPTGGAGGYTYNWTPGNPTGDGTTSVTGLTAGSWTCTVTDNYSCTKTQVFTITQPAGMSISGTSQTNVACNGASNGAAAISTPTGGAGGYTYNWTPGNPTGDGTTSVTGLTAGSWTCTVTDVNGCTASQSFTITQTAGMSISGTSQTNIACNGGSTGAASIVTPTGGAGGYTYNWTPGNPTGDGTTSVTGLVAGTWTCTVTDANGCNTTRTFTITQPSAISISGTSQTNIACNGGSSGAASINTPTGGAGGYSYNWTPGNPAGDGTISVTGLAALTWTCTVTDANSCTATRTFSITQPTALVVTAASQTNVACNGASNGAAAVNTPTGGAGGYTYNWTPGNPTGDGTTSVTGLSAGSWTCTVTDVNGCTASQTFTITQTAGMSISGTSQTNIACNGGSTGAASIVTPTGGAGGYTYNWTPGNPIGDGTTSVTGLVAGTWTCTVTDANGCSATRTFTITQPSAISSSVAAITNISCNGLSNGSAMISASGGTPDYTYSWAPSGGTAATATGLTAGAYTCTITDANSCTKTQTATLSQPSVLTSSLSAITNLACNGGSNGSATVSASGGTPGYNYSWTPTGGTAATATGLTAGAYTCTITDANGCTKTQSATLTQPPSLNLSIAAQTNVSCAGGSNGSITVSATGGAGGYSYSWAPSGGTAATASGLTAGAYTCTVTDANGCSNTISATLTPLVTVPISATGTVYCFGGSGTISATGATTYTWSPATNLSASTGASVTANPTGNTTYTVTGTLSGCTATATATVTVNAFLPVNAGANRAICFGSSTVLAGSGATTYVWSPATGLSATTGNSVTANPTNTTTYTLIGSTGSCSNSATVTISVNPLATASTINGTSTICQGSGTALTATGGTTGGVWSSTNTAAATVSPTGFVSGIAQGNTTISYTVDNGCGLLAATFNMTINPLPIAPDPITGPSVVCTGSTISLSSSAGGVWSSSNTTRATVNTSGVVTGIIQSPVTISYTVTNGCGNVSALAQITVNATPSTISGPTSVCIGTLITLTNTPGGGVWSSPDATVSVVAGNGKVTGVSPGTALISYNTGSGCAATTIISVTSTPGAFGGTLSACPGLTTALTCAPAGGTWSSSTTAKAIVDELTGVVTGVSPGVVYITYSLGAGCYNTTPLTVSAAPNAITGAFAICPGATTDLNSTTGGGVWTSDNTAIATVNSTTGLVTSVAGVGTTTISYVVGSLCPRTVVVTVAASSANVGTPVVCLGQPISVAVLTNPTPGGTWSSSNPLKAPINQVTGVVKGISAGTVTITYQLGPGCVSTSELTINPAVAPVTGPAAICPGATAMFGNTTPDGTWSSSNTAVATAGTSGLVAGIFEGTTTISYIVNEGCYKTTDITIYGSMSDISGTDIICAGSETTLSSGPAGGTWSSGHATANINVTTGLLIGVSAGTAMITYRNSSSGCYVARQVTINGSVATITGTANICPGSSTTLGNGDAGGVWSSGNTAVATVDASGSVTGISSGTAIITYMTTPACYKTTIQTIKTAPSAIGGGTDVCQNATATLTSGPAGGVWSSSNMANATISTVGVVRGIAPGATTIQYLLSSGCLATKDVTVNSLPDAITGVTNVCVNATTDLFSSPSGGVWSSSNTVKSTIDATTGVLTGKSAGNSNITYMLPSGCYVKTTATTKAPPAAITGTTTITMGGAQILYCSPGGGAWSSANPAVASYNPVAGGRTYGAGTGTTTVSYTIPSTGCFSTTEVTVVSPRPGQGISVNGDVKMFNIYPNPSKGVLNVETSVNGTFAVFTIDGRQVASYEITETASTLSLPNDLTPGVYMCRFTGEDGSTEMVRLVYER